MYSMDFLFHLAALPVALLAALIYRLWNRRKKPGTARLLAVAAISYLAVYLGTSGLANYWILRELRNEMGPDALVVSPERRTQIDAIEELDELCRDYRSEWPAGTAARAFAIIDTVVPNLRDPLEAALTQCLVRQHSQREFAGSERPRLMALADASPANLAKYDDILRMPGSWRDVFALQGLLLWTDRHIAAFDAVVRDTDISPHARREYVLQAVQWCRTRDAALPTNPCTTIFTETRQQQLQKEEVYRCSDVEDLRHRYRLASELTLPGCTEAEPMELFLFGDSVDWPALRAQLQVSSAPGT